ncbi:MAG: hypothetical protein KAK01_00015 [Candidatus Marinimicrobia bacterium]|nr:hypothetical protein [Candidatus Neomarinimicrobiota bacterium]
MRKLIIGTGVLLILACTGKSPEFPWTKLSFDVVQQTAGDKLIMLDFYTEW